METATDIILEVGAGRGTYSRRALDRMNTSSSCAVLKLVLTDVSPDMVAQLQQTFINNHTNTSTVVEIEQVNAVELPYADHSIDCYLANLVLHHTSDTEKALNEAFRVLKKGSGRLCITEVDARNMGTMFAIPQKAMKLLNIGGESSDNKNHHAHNHGHAAPTATYGATRDEKQAQQQDEHNHHHHHHNHNQSTDNDDMDSAVASASPRHDHAHAMRHSGADDWRRMVRAAGFVDVVAWHLDCICETHNAERFAQNWLAHQRSKEEADGRATMTPQQEEQFMQEMRRMAQAELDAGRPITFGTVILTAYKQNP